MRRPPVSRRRPEAADNYLKLSPLQRHARRVARMLLAAHPAGTPADLIDTEKVLRDEYTDQASADAVYEGQS